MFPLRAKATNRPEHTIKRYLPRAKPPIDPMPEQKVTSLGQSHRSSKCQSKRLPPWAKPPIEQMPEQKVTSLDPLFANGISLIHNGQAGQGAGRRRGVRPTMFAEFSELA